MMECCPSCGAYLVFETAPRSARELDLAMGLQIDQNFDPEMAAATREVLAECHDPEKLMPAVSRFALQLIPMIQDPKVDMVRLANHIEKDEALVANILRVANSAYYQGRGSITKVSEALVRLGIKQTQSVILATISRQMHLIKNDRLGVLGDKLWYHAVAVSFACQEMSNITGDTDPDEAYAAGLLHDIGRAIVLRALNELLIARKVKLGDELERKAVTIMDFLHVKMGERLLGQWGLPEVLTLPVSWHHSNDDPDEHTDIVRLIKAMDQLCIVAGFGSSEHAATDLTQEEIADRYGYNHKTFADVRELLQ
jgi:HD-like signal output (HDOD) protein